MFCDWYKRNMHLFLILVGYSLVRTASGGGTDHQPNKSPCTRFWLKHWSSGMFVRAKKNSQGTNELAVYNGNGSEFWFEIVEGIWGYIHLSGTSLILHPEKDHHRPRDNTRVVLHSGRHKGALFAVDEGRKCIRHKGGKCLHVKNAYSKPKDGTILLIHSGFHDPAKLQAVCPGRPSEPAMVYGYPEGGGNWEIISSVLEPKSEHTITLEHTIGMSESPSGSDSRYVSFLWESGLRVESLLKTMTANMSSNKSKAVMHMLEKTSTKTWLKGSRVARQIRVKPGQSVVTWQWVYYLTQLNRTILYRSDVVADTNSMSKPPNLDNDSHLPSKKTANLSLPCDIRIVKMPPRSVEILPGEEVKLELQVSDSKTYNLSYTWEFVDEQFVTYTEENFPQELEISPDRKSLTLNAYGLNGDSINRVLGKYWLLVMCQQQNIRFSSQVSTNMDHLRKITLLNTPPSVVNIYPGELKDISVNARTEIPVRLTFYWIYRDTSGYVYQPVDFPPQLVLLDRNSTLMIDARNLTWHQMNMVTGYFKVTVAHKYHSVTLKVKVKAAYLYPSTTTLPLTSEMPTAPSEFGELRTISIGQEEKTDEVNLMINCPALGPVVASLVLTIILCVGAIMHKNRKTWTAKKIYKKIAEWKKAQKSKPCDINITSNFDAVRHVYRTEKVETNIPTTEAVLLHKVNNL